MTRGDLDKLREQLSWLRPFNQIELPVCLVRELLDEIDRLETIQQAQELARSIDAIEGKP